MACAVHELTTTTSLAEVASRFYAVRHPDGRPDTARVRRVCDAIRRATRDLAARDDQEALDPGTVLLVPTLRSLRRAVLPGDEKLGMALARAGFDHAAKLLGRSVEDAVAALETHRDRFPREAVERAWMLTWLFDLDGMDPETARFLHASGLDSIAAFRRQSPAALGRLLQRHAQEAKRPAALLSQGHARRWWRQAQVLGRKRVAARSRLRALQVPVRPADAAREAEHYEAVAAKDTHSAEDRALARDLALLRRFQEAFVRANLQLLSGRSRQAAERYQAARRYWHRLAESVGAAARIDDRRGIDFSTSVETCRRLIERLPPDDSRPLGSPGVPTRFGGHRPVYGVRDTAASNSGADRVVALPSPTGGVARVALGNRFAEEYEEQFVRPRRGTPTATRFDDAAWADPAAFTAAIPLLYADALPRALGHAYTNTGAYRAANEFGRVQSTRPEPVPHGVPPDRDLFACSSDFVEHGNSGSGHVEMEAFSVLTTLDAYARDKLAEADQLYREDRRDEATSMYEDVICAIENHWHGVEKSFLASDCRIGFAAVYQTAPTAGLRTLTGGVIRSPTDLSTFAGAYSDGTPILDDYVVATVASPPPESFSAQVDSASTWFTVQATALETTLRADYVDVSLAATAGSPLAFGATRYFVDASLLDLLYDLYAYAQAKLQALAMGLNWYGYPDEYVPPWSFDHLYGVAHDLCNRALAAEERVLNLLQLFETAEEEEFLATQSVQIAWEQAKVADLRVSQQVALNDLALFSAQLAETQAEAEARKSATRGTVEFEEDNVQPLLTYDEATGEWVPRDLTWEDYELQRELDLEAEAGVGANLATALTSIPYAGGMFSALASTFTAEQDHLSDLEVLQAAKQVTDATLVANAAALAVAQAERDVAWLSATQAEEYLAFLQEQLLDSEGYAFLLSLARDVHESMLHHANRMAWLARRALEYESRRSFDLVQLSYQTGDELTDLTRAQRLTAHLEATRSEYVAGATQRLQEVKWTLALGQYDPAALGQLRETGTCTFRLRQRALDQLFPGMALHRMKDARVQIVGLLPPEGARGVLELAGACWVRVPNDGVYRVEETRSDWTTLSLAASSTYPPYEGYVMKRLVGTPAVLALSEFDVRSDRAVLSSPQGMLKPLEHLGLDAGWSLTLHRQSNDFEFANIRDVEITVWFLCAYDRSLETAQAQAWAEDGAQGRLSSAVRHSFAAHSPTAWSATVASPSGLAAPSERRLVWEPDRLPPWETARRLTNIRLVAARLAGRTDELTLRLRCDADPVGCELTTTDGAALSLIDVDLSADPDPPTANATLEAWVRDTFYRSGVPDTDPRMRWVVKVDATTAEQWAATDDDGAPVLGRPPLLGSAGVGASGLARYRDGEGWTNVTMAVTLTHRGGTCRARVRDVGGACVAAEIAPTAVRIVRIDGAVVTELASRPLAYSGRDRIRLQLQVVGDLAGLTIDGIPIFDGVAIGGGPAAGSVALEVADSPNGAIPFEDVRVVRMTGKGARAETLLADAFLAPALPSDWVFQDGATPWRFAATAAPALDLSELLNLTLILDYLYEMVTT